MDVTKAIKFVFILMLGCLPGIQPNQDACKHGPMDIIFVLDASSSIWPVDFVTQLGFVQNLTKSFDVGPGKDQTRVGLLTFSSRWKVEFHLKDRMDKAELSKAIRRVRHLTGGTNTGDAIEYVSDNMFLPKNGGRKDTKHIVVVITDGESYYKKETAAASEKLRQQGVTVFAIGVGFRVDLEELKSIASSPSDQYVIEVFSYKSLQKIQSRLTQRTCEVTIVPIKEAPTKPTKPVTIPTTRVTTPTKTTTTTPTTTTTASTTTPATSAPTPETTKTTTASTTTSTTSAPSPETTTTTTAHTTTSTTSAPTPETTPPTASTTATTTTTVKTTIASTGVIGANSNNIQADREKITKNCGGKPADVFFLVDTSGSIRPSDFKKQLDFIRNIVDIFDISHDKTRVGLSTFSHEYNPIFGLDRYDNKTALLKAIDSVPYSGGGTDTGNAIKQMREHEFSRRFTRPAVAHIVVVLTDGLSRFPKQTAKEAALVKKTGTYVFAVGIGTNIDQLELSNIASSPDGNVDTYAFRVFNFDALNSLKNILAIKTCEIATYQQDERVCMTDKSSNVMFVYDAAFFGYRWSNTFLDIIEQVTMYLATTGGKIQSGIHTSTCLMDVNRPLSIDPLEVKQDYDGLPVLISDLRKSHGFINNEERQAASKIVVIFTENISKMTEREILRNKFLKIQFVFVQIGSNSVEDSLVKLSGKPHHVVALQDQTNVYQVAEHLKAVLCEGY